MTIKQLELANEIVEKIKELRHFKTAFDDTGCRNDIVAHHHQSTFTGELKEDNGYLYLGAHPELTQMISNYISDRIKELEKQLERL